MMMLCLGMLCRITRAPPTITGGPGAELITLVSSAAGK